MRRFFSEFHRSCQRKAPWSLPPQKEALERLYCLLFAPKSTRGIWCLRPGPGKIPPSHDCATCSVLLCLLPCLLSLLSFLTLMFLLCLRCVYDTNRYICCFSLHVLYVYRAPQVRLAAFGWNWFLLNVLWFQWPPVKHPAGWVGDTFATCNIFAFTLISICSREICIPLKSIWPNSILGPILSKVMKINVVQSESFPYIKECSLLASTIRSAARTRVTHSMNTTCLTLCSRGIWRHHLELCLVAQTIPEQLLQCLQGILLLKETAIIRDYPCHGVGKVQCIGRWYMSH